MTALIKRHPLVAFFVLAYLGSWLVWSPWWALSSNGLGLVGYQLPLSAVQGINQLGLFAGPFAAAILVSHVADGSAKPLLNRIFRFRAPGRAYLIALVVIPIVLVAGPLLWPSEVAVDRPTGVGLVTTLLTTFVIYLVGGPIQEEPGWRGFALPRLQRRLHPTAAALLLGAIWCCWHAPLFLTAEWDTPRGKVGDLLAYLVFVVGLSVLLGWVANSAPDSIWLPILGHNAVNWTLFAMPLLTGIAIPELWPVALAVAAAALVVVALTRGRLGLASAA